MLKDSDAESYARKRFPHKSAEINAMLGDRMLGGYLDRVHVDLKNAELVLGVKLGGVDLALDGGNGLGGGRYDGRGNDRLGLVHGGRGVGYGSSTSSH